MKGLKSGLKSWRNLRLSWKMHTIKGRLKTKLMNSSTNFTKNSSNKDFKLHIENSANTKNNTTNNSKSNRTKAKNKRSIFTWKEFSTNIKEYKKTLDWMSKKSRKWKNKSKIKSIISKSKSFRNLTNSLKNIKLHWTSWYRLKSTCQKGWMKRSLICRIKWGNFSLGSLELPMSVSRHSPSSKTLSTAWMTLSGPNSHKSLN